MRRAELHKAGLTEGADRSSRLRMKRMWSGKISRKAAPRNGGKVLSEPDLASAGSRDKLEARNCGPPVGMAVRREMESRAGRVRDASVGSNIQPQVKRGEWR
jgi:hypothetical protein